MTIKISNEMKKNREKKLRWKLGFRIGVNRSGNRCNGNLWMSGFDLWLSLFTFSVEIIRKQIIYVLFFFCSGEEIIQGV